eukprot:GHVP01055517.1.p2 GENE.GHVP01055517.1~~GHVP01055517.1.p2  ORF type:complete len:138 (+),score=40.96 GHVP01055517.1:124-537(+)
MFFKRESDSDSQPTFLKYEVVVKILEKQIRENQELQAQNFSFVREILKNSEEEKYRNGQRYPERRKKTEPERLNQNPVTEDEIRSILKLFEEKEREISEISELATVLWKLLQQADKKCSELSKENEKLRAKNEEFAK